MIDEEPPWPLLSPFTENTTLALGWVLGTLSPIRSGGANLLLRHDRHGTARVVIRRNRGAPRGVAHTRDLDFLVWNGGAGTARTESSLGRVLLAFASALDKRHDPAGDAPLLEALRPHGEDPEPETTSAPPRPTGDGSLRIAPRRVTPTLDVGRGTVTFDVSHVRLDPRTLEDAARSFEDRSEVVIGPAEGGKLTLEFTLKELTPKVSGPPDALKRLARDATKALNHVPRSENARLNAVLAELEAADPATVGVGFVPERGPEHENLRVLNIRGTGACNSDCVFCVEKFDPSHRSTPNADATRQMILGAAGQFDMLFFASGEPTIHPKLFEYVELGRSVGFTRFGMSSHFRTFADPHFARRILEAGFRYFDISLHAADTASQLAVNPIADDGRSLHEALKGLAVLFRLAQALDVPISVTQKIVVSRLNAHALESIFRATYDRGVRHFILQPVKTLGLAPELRALLAIPEDEAISHLNELLRKTAGLGAVIKPYGYSRQGLLAVEHLETEQNRVKNVYGKSIEGLARETVVPFAEERPSDGRHWVEIKLWRDTRAGADQERQRWRFAADGTAPILDEALDRGMDASFGCRMGSCGMCCARLLAGTVDQSEQIFLSDDQVRQGYVLLCQARPLSDVVLEACTAEEIDAL